LAYFLAPPIILEMQSFYSNFSSYLEGLPQALSSLGFEFKSIASFVLTLKDSLVQVSSNIFGLVSSLLVVFLPARLFCLGFILFH